MYCEHIETYDSVYCFIHTDVENFERTNFMANSEMNICGWNHLNFIFQMFWFWISETNIYDCSNWKTDSIVLNLMSSSVRQTNHIVEVENLWKNFRWVTAIDDHWWLVSRYRKHSEISAEFVEKMNHWFSLSNEHFNFCLNCFYRRFVFSIGNRHRTQKLSAKFKLNKET